ncbi:MAG: DNA repair protein RadC [Candidatus Tectomicrobia bacterium]|nr:DNA repair protein RadC [Candidatus Tectomicrobia bacterium]
MAKKEYLQTIKDWPEDERPRERLMKYGADLLSDAQLLAIALSTGNSAGGQSALDLARVILDRFGDLSALDSATISELCSIPGIGKAKACQVKAAIEIGKRSLSQRGKMKTKLSTSQDVANYYLPLMSGLKKEVFRSVLLDAKNRLLKDVTISAGSLSNSIVHPREAFVAAIRESAAAVIFLHNHPSGDPTPSEEDIGITRRLIQTGEIIGIRVLDHIIVGDKRYISFLDEGLM